MKTSSLLLTRRCLEWTYRAYNPLWNPPRHSPDEGTKCGVVLSSAYSDIEIRSYFLHWFCNEELSSSQSPKLTGSEKRSIAINITKLIIEDLHEHGQIDEEVYGWMNLGLTFLAPALFSGIKALFSKIQDVAEDIEENGGKGCFYRNCLRKKDLKSKK